MYRLSKKSDGDSNFHLIYKPTDFSGKGYTIPRVAVADLGKTTRLYVSDSDVFANPGRDGEPAGSTNVYRLDNAWAACHPQACGARGGQRLEAADLQVDPEPGVRGLPVLPDAVRLLERHRQPGRAPERDLARRHLRLRRPEVAPADWSNGRTVIRSTDGGLTWNDMSADTESPPYIMHPDQHAMAFLAEQLGRGVPRVRRWDRPHERHVRRPHAGVRDPRPDPAREPHLQAAATRRPRQELQSQQRPADARVPERLGQPARHAARAARGNAGQRHVVVLEPHRLD
jgi:hypothetical protein